MRKSLSLIFIPSLIFFSLPIQAQKAPLLRETSPAEGSIQVVSAVFGKLGRERKLDISALLQQLCGNDAKSCQVFCSETSFGRYRLGKRPICRVTYRCGVSFVRSVEAAREEPILMRCPETVATLPPPLSN